jgi:cytochrome c biogenesis protein CcdA
MMNSQSIALIFLVFSIGVMIPFVGIGLFAGSISKVARGTYRHKSLIKGISGLILIGYAAYLIVTSLL